MAKLTREDVGRNAEQFEDRDGPGPDHQLGALG
jgi:hypothetical protein